jgi:hypothetical protein
VANAANLGHVGSSILAGSQEWSGGRLMGCRIPALVYGSTTPANQTEWASLDIHAQGGHQDPHGQTCFPH